MEKTNTRSSDRFAFPGSGWIVLLMLASALVGAAAGHFYGAAQPAAAAQVAAPVLTQAEPAVSAATGPVPNVAQSGISDETELRQEINAMRQERKSDRPTAEVAPVDTNTAPASAALEEQYHMRLSEQLHANVAPVDTNTVPTSGALEQYRMRLSEQTHAVVASVEVNTGSAASALVRLHLKLDQ